MDDDDYFISDPDWAIYATRNDLPLPSNATPKPLDQLEPTPIDFRTSRARQLAEHADWRATHPLKSVGYTSQFSSVTARDGTEIGVKISHPLPSRLHWTEKGKLPVLFVTHGGGWIQGGHTGEEAWLLWPIYEHFDFVIISVEYRLAPDHPFPTWINDSWDVLAKVITAKDPTFIDLEVGLDPEKIFLAGSSAGADISAALSQICRDRGISIPGVILNVPVLCDYRHLTTAQTATGCSLDSYSQGSEALLSSNTMMWIWNTLYPSSSSSADPQVSPLLGDCGGLPRHLIFVAGQDALRDEGIAYAKKLNKAGVQVELEIYRGVSHIFAEIWELQATKRFWDDVRRHLQQWLS